jgi:chromosome segregation ATPase
MEILAKNDMITTEIVKNNLIDISDVLDNIKGVINIEKIYTEIFARLKINFYADVNDKYYIEIKEYVEKVSNNKCTDKQILNNKFAIDKKKIKKFSDIKIKKCFSKNYNIKSKTIKLIEVNDLQNLNFLIKKYSTELNETFDSWQQLCEAMVIQIPKLLETACKKYFKQELDKIYVINEDLQHQINLLKTNHDKKEKRINELEHKVSEFVKDKDKQKEQIDGKEKRINELEHKVLEFAKDKDKQQEQLDNLSKRFDGMRQLIQ